MRPLPPPPSPCYNANTTSVTKTTAPDTTVITLITALIQTARMTVSVRDPLAHEARCGIIGLRMGTDMTTATTLLYHPGERRLTPPTIATPPTILTSRACPQRQRRAYLQAVRATWKSPMLHPFTQRLITTAPETGLDVRLSRNQQDELVFALEPRSHSRLSREKDIGFLASPKTSWGMKRKV